MIVLVAIVDGTLLVHSIWGCELVFMMVQLVLKYQDEDDLLEYQNTCVAEFKGHVVVYRAPVLGEDQRGLEEKSPIHVADEVRMMGDIEWEEQYPT